MQGISQNAQAFISTEERYGAHNYHPLDIVISKAEGVWLWDVDGKKYLDCISAYSAVNQGHCHPRIYNALVEQAQRLTLTSRALRNDRMPEFLKRLTELCEYDMALPVNTGVEAIETAFKLARKWGYEVKGISDNAAEIIIFSNNFHGRTITAISASATPEYQKNFGPLTPGFVVVPYGDALAFERAITPNTCAIVIEPIQGEGGVIVPPEGFLKHAQALCNEHNVLFVADEIQTGFGRTGELFACGYDGVTPDVLVVGKALGGGFYPVAAVLANAPIMELFRPGDHGSTFGGNPLAAAVAIAAMDVIVEERLAACAKEAGERITRELRTIHAALPKGLVRELRGRGLLLGIEYTKPARSLSEALLARGVAAKDTHERVLRIAPPLVIDDAAISHFLHSYQEALTHL